MGKSVLMLPIVTRIVIAVRLNPNKFAPLAIEA